jgi:stage V sporulation protein AE
VDGLTRKVVVLTDGDRIATKVVEKVAKNIGGRAISLSGGNPTEVTGSEIAEAVKSTPYDPVLVMVDDCGAQGTGRGEKALKELAKDPEIQILGAVAVASNTAHVEGISADVSVTREGEIIEASVDKDGNRKGGSVIEGDTVDILNRLNISVVVGVGDLGKMQDADLVSDGARITTIAVQEVLKRSHFL